MDSVNSRRGFKVPQNAVKGIDILKSSRGEYAPGPLACSGHKVKRPSTAHLRRAHWIVKMVTLKLKLSPPSFKNPVSAPELGCLIVSYGQIITCPLDPPLTWTFGIVVWYVDQVKSCVRYNYALYRLLSIINLKNTTEN